MKIFAVLFIFVTFFSVSLFANPESEKILKIERENKDIAEFMNSYTSPRKLFKDLVLLGILRANDQREIIGFLEEEKVKLDTPAPKVIAKGLELHFGPGAVLTHDPKQGLRSSNGKYLKIERGQSVPEIFRMVYKNEKSKIKSAYQFLIPEAHADIEIFFYPMAWIYKQSFGLMMGDIILPASGVAAGMIAAELNEKLALRNFFTPQSVRCVGNAYKIEIPKKATWIQSYKAEKEKCEAPGTGELVDYQIRGHISYLCRVTHAGWQYLADVVKDLTSGPETRFHDLDEKLLKNIFPTSIPPCSEDNAKQVNETMRSQFGEIVQKINATFDLNPTSDKNSMSSGAQ